MGVMLNYKKVKNLETLKEMEDMLDVSSLQNYIPIYKRFFELNELNWNNIHLENHRRQTPLREEDDCLYCGDTPVFIKFSPILDPLKYLTGKYESYDYTLPSFKGHSLTKMDDVNNSSYVDGFFTFLSDQMYSKGFIHGIPFYGSYLGIKHNFEYCIEDDVDHLQDSPFFHKQKDTLYSLSRAYSFSDSQTNKKRLCLESEEVELVLDSLDDSIHSKKSESDESHEELTAIIHQFPTHVILMERNEETLDFLLDELSEEELRSALMQVIMILITYQKVFKFTHNDLHTNNIMFVTTKEKYVSYKYNNVVYLVPTFGKIYKLIDYGRSIYTYQKRLFMSDSFHPDGDAATQYNYGPYQVDDEPCVEPNPSFDLCRLACSMMECIPDDHSLYPVVKEWCQDDDNKCMIWSSDGTERYPDFELYRMIALSVHRHTPQAQLDRPEFAIYRVPETQGPYMDIDAYEEL
jgi:hypothetical protein